MEVWEESQEQQKVAVLQWASGVLSTFGARDISSFSLMQFSF
jgi:hypothetical protein